MPFSFATLHQARGRLPNLRHRARRRAQLGRVERLHRIDHADLGALALERLANNLQLGLGQDLDPAGATQPLGAKLDLRRRLLARDEQAAATLSDRLERTQKQSRLADAGLAADEHERGRHQSAAENAVELGHSSRNAIGLGRLDLDQTQQRPLNSRCFRGERCNDLLAQSAEALATRAAPEPAPGRVTALRARKLNGGLRHGRRSLRTGPDGDCADSTSFLLSGSAQKERTPGRESACAKAVTKA